MRNGHRPRIPAVKAATEKLYKAARAVDKLFLFRVARTYSQQNIPIYRRALFPSVYCGSDEISSKMNKYLSSLGSNSDTDCYCGQCRTIATPDCFCRLEICVRHGVFQVLALRAPHSAHHTTGLRMRWLKFRKFKKFRKPPKQPDPNQTAPGPHDPSVDLGPDVRPQGVFRSVILPPSGADSATQVQITEGSYLSGWIKRYRISGFSYRSPRP